MTPPTAIKPFQSEGDGPSPSEAELGSLELGTGLLSEAKLDGALGTLISWVASLPMVGWLKLDDF